MDDFELRVLLTRKIKRAVDRNRIKRVLREFFRQKRALLRGSTVICRVDPSTEKLKNADIFQELSKGLSAFSFTFFGGILPLLSFVLGIR